MLSAYSDGINAFISESTLPIEFYVFNYTPEPWTPIDSLAIIRLVNFFLSLNWKNEMVRDIVDDMNIHEEFKHEMVPFLDEHLEYYLTVLNDEDMAGEGLLSDKTLVERYKNYLKNGGLVEPETEP